VKGCHAVLSALLVFIPIAARAADDGSGAARELARKTATLAGRGEPVSLAWSNLSSMGFSELAQARSAFEAALREAGCRISDIGPTADARITLSENRTQYLLVEEIRKGEDRQVWIASWKRTGIASKTSAGVTLEREHEHRASGVRADPRKIEQRVELVRELARLAHERQKADLWELTDSGNTGVLQLEACVLRFHG